MARIVVPFRGLAGKQRLTGLGPEGHRVVVLAMLADVLAATTTVGLTVVVTNDLEGRRLAKEAGALLGATPLGGIGLVASADGRTNALSLPVPNLFEPLYGPRSAERFQRAARELGLDAVAVAIPNLADDVDTRKDLDRVHLRAGPHTQSALQELRIAS